MSESLPESLAACVFMLVATVGLLVVVPMSLDWVDEQVSEYEAADRHFRVLQQMREGR